MRISVSEARQVGTRLHVNFDKIDAHELQKGIEVEWEHRKTVGNKLETIAKIALDHLKERKDYYSRLKIVESKRKL